MRIVTARNSYIYVVKMCVFLDKKSTSRFARKCASEIYSEIYLIEIQPPHREQDNVFKKLFYFLIVCKKFGFHL